MKTAQIVPDALFIGFQRSGTTFIRNYFSAHPQISWGRNAVFFMTSDFRSDPNRYFSLHSINKPTYKVYIDCYESLAIGYLQAEPGSWSADDLVPDWHSNLEIPSRDEIPMRIKQLLPNCKIIMVIRNQVDWLRSNYLHFIPGLPEGHKRFSDFVKTPEGKRLLNAGLFSDVIETYRKSFGESNVHIIIFERLKGDGTQALRELCEFLEIEFAEYPEEKRGQNTGRSRLDAKIMLALDRARISKTALKPLAPLRPLANRFIGGLFKQDPLTKTEKEFIRSFYSVSNRQLAQQLDIDLAEFGYL